MPTTVIYALGTREILFSGDFASIKHGLEAAVARKTPLHNADLRFLDLAHANLDGAELRGADLSDANLFGANLSESDLTGAKLRESDLAFACLAESRLVDTDFSNTTFGGTILTGAVISDCIFSCPTALDLPFGAAAKHGANTYFHDNLTPLVFTAAPVVVTGLPNKIVLLDDIAIVGNTVRRRPAGILGTLEDLCRAYG